jgi:hypothetical protein
MRVIFEDIDPIWLRTMWEDGGSARDDMIDGVPKNRYSQ